MSIEIALASVNTLVPIRNERMQSMLFETDLFPRATITSQINSDGLAKWPLAVVKVVLISLLNCTISRRSTTRRWSIVGRLADNPTLKPIVVNAESFDLVAGVEALRELPAYRASATSSTSILQFVFELKSMPNVSGWGY